MKKIKFKISWPNNIETQGYDGEDWFDIAKRADFNIPTGCLTGSCGACEIDVNGQTVRPCITSVINKEKCPLKVSLTSDPFWE